jgi:hypothetical protein
VKSKRISEQELNNHISNYKKCYEYMNNREDNNGMIQVRNDLGDLYITLNVLENQKENYIEKAKDEYNNGLNCLFHYPNILQSWRSL